MALTSERARWMLSHRGALKANEYFKPLGYPNLVKARQTLARKREAQAEQRLSANCRCPHCPVHNSP